MDASFGGPDIRMLLDSPRSGALSPRGEASPIEVKEKLHGETKEEGKRTMRLINYAIHVLFNQPSMAWFRISENARKTVPVYADDRHKMKDICDITDGKIYDVEFATECVVETNKQNPGATFRDIQVLLGQCTRFMQFLIDIERHSAEGVVVPTPEEGLKVAVPVPVLTRHVKYLLAQGEYSPDEEDLEDTPQAAKHRHDDSAFAAHARERSGAVFLGSTANLDVHFTKPTDEAVEVGQSELTANSGLKQVSSDENNPPEASNDVQTNSEPNTTVQQEHTDPP